MPREYLISMLLALAACTPSPAERAITAEAIARPAGLQPATLSTTIFPLARWQRVGRIGGDVTIYIEGDGFAWETPTRPSADPTPIDPLALRLAARDSAENIVYLARPCQYDGIHATACERSAWTDGRFAPTVIASYREALDRIAVETRASRLHLVGYSGGGAIALLAAVGRTDIADIRTVAGNLDSEAWTTLHAISPLTHSRNPAEAAVSLRAVPQLHFIGTEDRIIPPAIAAAYRRRVADSPCIAIHPVQGATHTDGWPTPWPALLQLPFPCGPQI